MLGSLGVGTQSGGDAFVCWVVFLEPLGDAPLHNRDDALSDPAGGFGFWCLPSLDNPALGSPRGGYWLPDNESDIGSASSAGRLEPPAGKGLELPLGLKGYHDVFPRLYPVDRPGHISSISIGLHRPHDSR